MSRPAYASSKFHILLFCLLVSPFLVVPNVAQAAGYRVLEHHDLRVHVWYPSDEPIKPGRLGPFDVMQADNAPVRDGFHQIVVMSHGYGGMARNHHLTAQALADHGFVVIAPDHGAEHLIDTRKREKALAWRMKEIGNAIRIVEHSPGFVGLIDSGQVHGVGYSLGSVTIMSAAGASVDLERVDQHCDEVDDPAFCEGAGLIDRWMMRFMRDVKVPDLSDETGNDDAVSPIINGRIAVIAPIAQGLIVNPSAFTADRVFVLGMAKDQINRPDFHAEPYKLLIPDGKLAHFDLNEHGNHSAFIAPFAKRVTDVEDIEAAIDPPGFNRRVFLDDLNAILADFFLQK